MHIIVSTRAWKLSQIIIIMFGYFFIISTVALSSAVGNMNFSDHNNVESILLGRHWYRETKTKEASIL